MIYAYARVSSKEQNLDRQLMAFRKAGVERKNIFCDKKSGKDFDRPEYKKLLSQIRPNDLIVIKSIDRLGRNYEEILAQWQYITKKLKVDIKVLDMPLLDTTVNKDILGTFISDLVLQILSFVAEQEHSSIRQRQKEGIKAAKAKGTRFGRPRKPLPDNFEQLFSRYLNGESIDQLTKDCPTLSKSTLRLRILERLGGK